MYEHEIDAYEDVFYNPESPTYKDDHVYDINTRVREIHKTMKRPSARLPTTAWYGLSEAGRTTWDNLTDIDKASIISNLSNNQKRPSRRYTPRSNHQSQPVPSPQMSRSAQIHEHDPDNVAQFQAAFHAFCVGNHDNDTTKPPMEENNILHDNNESLHAFMTQRPPKKAQQGQPKTPGNINRLLSPPPPQITDAK